MNRSVPLNAPSNDLLPAFSPLTDLPIAVLVFGVTLTAILFGVHGTDQQRVPKTRETTRRLCVRLTLVAVVLVLVCCLANVAFWLVALTVFTLVAAASAGELLGILGLPFVVIGYLINEYVLGFPGISLGPPTSAGDAKAKPDLTSHIGCDAVAVVSLRPEGQIEIEGERVSAVSESGKLISEGTSVTVTGVKSGRVLVREQAGVG